MGIGTGIGEIGERLRRSTVHIRSTDRGRQSAGSGVVWDSMGIVVTNAHVLGGGSYSVELWDGRSFPAELVERDDHRDLARLKLGTFGLPTLSSREDIAKPGELVIAVGNPLGFTGALTTGVVHAIGPMPGLGRKPWVQAAIRLAPGNSGGPLADATGRLLGINTMIVSGGIALAVPVAMVEQFVRNGPGPRLGVTVQAVSLMRRKGVGLVILKVDQGSPAEQASLLIGDVLIGTRESNFETAGDLGDSVTATGAGILHLRFLRGNSLREREVPVALEGRSGKRAA
jgi:serine protease Do